MSATASPDLSELVSTIDPARIAACLDASLSQATLERLRASSRLHGRLVRLVLGDVVEEQADGPRTDPLFGAIPRRAALLAGSIWHARSLLKLIAGKDIAVFVERIGGDVQAFGIRHVERAVSSSVITGPERLADAVEQDGHACLGAWLSTLPEGDRRNILMRLPPGTPAEQATVDAAVAGEIFAVVLPHLAAETGKP